MTTDTQPEANQWIEAALVELKGLITERFPNATFVVSRGEDPPGIYLLPTVDVEDTDDVFEVVVERLLKFQVGDGLPVYVTPLRPIARVMSELRSRQATLSAMPLPG